MSTQNSEGIPVSIRAEKDLERLRLLELPPELLALVTSDNPPRLELKSKEDPDETQSKDASVVLCTSNSTYNIRQVSTSNSLYVVQPQQQVDDSGGLPRTAIEAVAKCDSTLELIPVTKQSAVPLIKASLPIFSSTGNYGTSTVNSKAELFSHIPLDEATCEEAWSDLACFESSNPAGCYIPHAKVRTQIWETALTVAIADDSDLSEPFILGDYPPFALDLQEDWPSSLIAAVFASVSISTPGGNLLIDKDKGVRVVGQNLLDAKSGGNPIDKSDFLKAWKDSVPEAWREKCDLAILRDSMSSQDTAGTITYAARSNKVDSAVEASTDAKSALGAKRKWHEKFRPQKKTV